MQACDVRMKDHAVWGIRPCGCVGYHIKILWMRLEDCMNWGAIHLRQDVRFKKLREVTSSNFFILVSANELLFHLRLWIHPHVVSSNWEFFIVVCICSRLKSLSECYCNRLIKDLIEMHLKMFFEIVIFDWYCDHKQLRMLFNCFDCFFVCKFFDWGP